MRTGSRLFSRRGSWIRIQLGCTRGIIIIYLNDYFLSITISLAKS
jgi:hypothetical protein